MFDYVIGIIVTLFSAFLFQLFGMCLTKKEEEYSYSFIIGYVVYSFLVALVGIPIQILNLPWMFFCIWMMVLLVGIIIFILLSIKKNRIKFTRKAIKKYFIKNWFLYIGAIIILLFSLTHLRYIWANNMTDDGYYLNKMATLAYVNNPFRTDPVTGFAKPVLDSYSLNTFELEGSFYLFITQMDPALYARFFLSLLNYFIILNAIQAFMEKIIRFIDLKLNSSLLQYFVPTVFFIFVLCAKIFTDTDAEWTILSAAYYGSSLVRTACTFIILLPLIERKKLDLNAVLITVMACIVMVSKSTISVPLLFVLAVGYLISLWLTEFKKENIVFILGIFFVLIVFGLLLPDVQFINDAMITSHFKSFKNILLIIPLIIILVLAQKNILYRKIFWILLISFFLLVCPEINDIVETVSQFTFVAERTRYSLCIFTLIVGYSPLILLFIRGFKQFKLINIGTLILVISLVLVTGYGNTNLLSSIKTYVRNPNIIPSSTINLGNKLEQYYFEKNEELIVVMPAGVILNGEAHFPSSIIRTYAPHVKSVVGGIRTSSSIQNEYSDFNGFSVDDYDVISKFYIDPNEQNLHDIAIVNEKYPFNCIVGQNFSNEHERLLNSIGYAKYADVENRDFTYNIYVRNLE